MRQLPACEKDRDLRAAKRMIQVLSVNCVGCNGLCLQEVLGKLALIGRTILKFHPQ
jgi:hypothetical protein